MAERGEEKIKKNVGISRTLLSFFSGIKTNRTGKYQRRWIQIGFVPIKHKDSLQKEYKAVVDEMFRTLRSSERDRSMNRFKERVANMKGGQQLRSEREKLYNKVRQMEQDIALLENNIGFFSKSKNAELRCTFLLYSIFWKNTKLSVKMLEENDKCGFVL